MAEVTQEELETAVKHFNSLKTQLDIDIGSLEFLSDRKNIKTNDHIREAANIMASSEEALKSMKETREKIVGPNGYYPTDDKGEFDIAKIETRYNKAKAAFKKTYEQIKEEQAAEKAPKTKEEKRAAKAEAKRSQELAEDLTLHESGDLRNLYVTSSTQVGEIDKALKIWNKMQTTNSEEKAFVTENTNRLNNAKRKIINYANSSVAKISEENKVRLARMIGIDKTYKYVSIDNVNRLLPKGEQGYISDNELNGKQGLMWDILEGKTGIDYATVVKATIGISAVSLLGQMGAFGAIAEGFALLAAFNPVVATCVAVLGAATLIKYARQIFAPEIKKIIARHKTDKQFAQLADMEGSSEGLATNEDVANFVDEYLSGKKRGTRTSGSTEREESGEEQGENKPTQRKPRTRTSSSQADALDAEADALEKRAEEIGKQIKDIKAQVTALQNGSSIPTTTPVAGNGTPVQQQTTQTIPVTPAPAEQNQTPVTLSPETQKADQDAKEARKKANDAAGKVAEIESQLAAIKNPDDMTADKLVSLVTAAHSKAEEDLSFAQNTYKTGFREGLFYDRTKDQVKEAEQKAKEQYEKFEETGKDPKEEEKSPVYDAYKKKQIALSIKENSNDTETRNEAVRNQKSADNAYAEAVESYRESIAAKDVEIQKALANVEKCTEAFTILDNAQKEARRISFMRPNEQAAEIIKFREKYPSLFETSPEKEAQIHELEEQLKVAKENAAKLDEEAKTAEAKAAELVEADKKKAQTAENGNPAPAQNGSKVPANEGNGTATPSQQAGNGTTPVTPVQNGAENPTQPANTGTGTPTTQNPAPQQNNPAVDAKIKELLALLDSLTKEVTELLAEAQKLRARAKALREQSNEIENEVTEELDVDEFEEDFENIFEDDGEELDLDGDPLDTPEDEEEQEQELENDGDELDDGGDGFDDDDDRNSGENGNDSPENDEQNNNPPTFGTQFKEIVVEIENGLKELANKGNFLDTYTSQIAETPLENMDQLMQKVSATKKEFDDLVTQIENLQIKGAELVDKNVPFGKRTKTKTQLNEKGLGKACGSFNSKHEKFLFEYNSKQFEPIGEAFGETRRVLADTITQIRKGSKKMKTAEDLAAVQTLVESADKLLERLVDLHEQVSGYQFEIRGNLRGYSLDGISKDLEQAKDVFEKAKGKIKDSSTIENEKPEETQEDEQEQGENEQDTGDTTDNDPDKDEDENKPGRLTAIIEEIKELGGKVIALLTPKDKAVVDRANQAIKTYNFTLNRAEKLTKELNQKTNKMNAKNSAEIQNECNGIRKELGEVLGNLKENRDFAIGLITTLLESVTVQKTNITLHDKVNKFNKTYDQAFENAYEANAKYREKVDELANAPVENEKPEENQERDAEMLYAFNKINSTAVKMMQVYINNPKHPDIPVLTVEYNNLVDNFEATFKDVPGADKYLKKIKEITRTLEKTQKRQIRDSRSLENEKPEETQENDNDQEQDQDQNQGDGGSTDDNPDKEEDENKPGRFTALIEEIKELGGKVIELLTPKDKAIVDRANQAIKTYNFTLNRVESLTKVLKHKTAKMNDKNSAEIQAECNDVRKELGNLLKNLKENKEFAIELITTLLESTTVEKTNITLTNKAAKLSQTYEEAFENAYEANATYGEKVGSMTAPTIENERPEEEQGENNTPDGDEPNKEEDENKPGFIATVIEEIKEFGGKVIELLTPKDKAIVDRANQAIKTYNFTLNRAEKLVKELKQKTSKISAKNKEELKAECNDIRKELGLLLGNVKENKDFAVELINTLLEKTTVEKTNKTLNGMVAKLNKTYNELNSEALEANANYREAVFELPEGVVPHDKQGEEPTAEEPANEEGDRKHNFITAIIEEVKELGGKVIELLTPKDKAIVDKANQAIKTYNFTLKNVEKLTKELKSKTAKMNEKNFAELHDECNGIRKEIGELLGNLRENKDFAIELINSIQTEATSKNTQTTLFQKTTALEGNYNRAYQNAYEANAEYREKVEKLSKTQNQDGKTEDPSKKDEPDTADKEDKQKGFFGRAIDGIRDKVDEGKAKRALKDMETRENAPEVITQLFERLKPEYDRAINTLVTHKLNLIEKERVLKPFAKIAREILSSPNYDNDKIKTIQALTEGMTAIVASVSKQNGKIAENGVSLDSVKKDLVENNKLGEAEFADLTNIDSLQAVLGGNPHADKENAKKGFFDRFKKQGEKEEPTNEEPVKEEPSAEEPAADVEEPSKKLGALDKAKLFALRKMFESQTKKLNNAWIEVSTHYAAVSNAAKDPTNRINEKNYAAMRDAFSAEGRQANIEYQNLLAAAEKTAKEIYELTQDEAVLTHIEAFKNCFGNGVKSTNDKGETQFTPATEIYKEAIDESMSAAPRYMLNEMSIFEESHPDMKTEYDEQHKPKEGAGKRLANKIKGMFSKEAEEEQETDAPAVDEPAVDEPATETPDKEEPAKEEKTSFADFIAYVKESVKSLLSAKGNRTPIAKEFEEKAAEVSKAHPTKAPVIDKLREYFSNINERLKTIKKSKEQSSELETEKVEAAKKAGLDKATLEALGISMDENDGPGNNG